MMVLFSKMRKSEKLVCEGGEGEESNDRMFSLDILNLMCNKH